MQSSDASASPRWFFANLVEVKLTQEAGGGAMSIVELSGPAGDMPPLHVHRHDDEAWYVLEGEMSFFVGSHEPTRGGPGSLAFGPKSVPHTIRVESSGPARWLAICTPGEFAGFVLAASRPAPLPVLPPAPSRPPSDEELAAITALGQQHGVDLLGPPAPCPTKRTEDTGDTWAGARASCSFSRLPQHGVLLEPSDKGLKAARPEQESMSSNFELMCSIYADWERRGLQLD